ncbi:MAG TPA: type II toxin-antitoxin system RelE/ParE family toxin [Cellvibrio sp.]|nr:type II toxin-antitoxin system RelE/ParE family toxin [Cellvibrio sp.]
MYKLSEAAASDIERILDWSLAEFGLTQTEEYYRSMSACMEGLAENPAMGVSIDGIRAGYRRFPHQSHVIFYTQMDWGILIVRVLHKRMDAPRQL